MTFLCFNSQHLCKQQWRPARVESECILGEGITFHFPDDKCNALDNSLSGQFDNNLSGQLLPLIGSTFRSGWNVYE